MGSQPRPDVAFCLCGVPQPHQTRPNDVTWRPHSSRLLATEATGPFGVAYEEPLEGRTYNP